MKIINIGIILAALVTFSNSTLATVFEATCNGCTPADTRAMVVGGVAADDGDWFIYDFVQGKLTHYSVTNSGNTVTVAANTAADLAVFNAAETLYNANGGPNVYGTSTVNVTPTASSALLPIMSTARPMVDQNGKINAFDMVSTPVFRQIGIDAAVNGVVWTASVRVVIANVLNVFTDNAIIKTPINSFITANFADGSSSVIQYNAATGTWLYVPNSSKDSIGNPIPETSVMAAGGLNSHQNYFFPAGATGERAGAQQVQNMLNLGIRGVEVITSGSEWQIACVNVADVTTCHASLF